MGDLFKLGSGLEDVGPSESADCVQVVSDWLNGGVELTVQSGSAGFLAGFDVDAVDDAAVCYLIQMPVVQYWGWNVCAAAARPDDV